MWGMDSNSVDINLARELWTYLEAYNLFGEHLALSIELSIFTASQLAAKLSVTPASISQWSNGKRLPDSGMVYKIAKGLNMNPPQRQSLMKAWTSTHFFRGYASYLDEAIAEQDLETIREILELTYTQ